MYAILQVHTPKEETTETTTTYMNLDQILIKKKPKKPHSYKKQCLDNWGKKNPIVVWIVLKFSWCHNVMNSQGVCTYNKTNMAK